MPQPTIPTDTVFDKANKVVKLEYLPIPDITADFHINHNTEVLLTMLRDLWDAVGLWIDSGLDISYDSGTGEWTVTPGRAVIDGYDVTFSSGITFSPSGGEKNYVIIRFVERQLTFETDPSDIGFTPPGFGTVKAGANQYRWEATLLHKKESDPAYTLSGQETSFVEHVLLETDTDGITVISKEESIGGSILGVLPSLITDVENALSIHDEFLISDVISEVITTTFGSNVPNWSIMEEMLLQPDLHFGFGCENYGLHPFGESFFLPSRVSIEVKSREGHQGFSRDMYSSLTQVQRENALMSSKNTYGFGEEGNFGNVPLGYGSTLTPVSPAEATGWGKSMMGLWPLGVPTQDKTEGLYLGRTPNRRFDISIKDNSADPDDNSSYLVDSKGVLLPPIRVIGGV